MVAGVSWMGEISDALPLCLTAVAPGAGAARGAEWVKRVSVASTYLAARDAVPWLLPPSIPGRLPTADSSLAAAPAAKANISVSRAQGWCGWSHDSCVLV